MIIVCDCGKKANKHSTMCTACRIKKYREKYPIKYAYDTLKTNAKRRGKPCTISLEYFTQLALEHGYMDHKGRYVGCMTLERINPLLGYVEGNITVLPMEENARKGAEDKKILNTMHPPYQHTQAPF